MIFNGLSSTNNLGGKQLNVISAEISVTIQPAGYAFSIWGLIYSLLGYRLK